jgi:flavin reductase (DIM6/NTAB) family NADH-FMN oxidoreductase RutF
MPIDRKEFRNALGQFATGVCIATTYVEGHGNIGVTINSFASVSLEPPLVLWSVQNSTEVAQVWEKASHYGISVLSEEQQDISNTYAKQGDHTIRSEHLLLGANGLPLIADTLTRFECKIIQRLDGGDHTILLGEVESMDRGEASNPLLFFSGQYRAISE